MIFRGCLVVRKIEKEVGFSQEFDGCLVAGKTEKGGGEGFSRWCTRGVSGVEKACGGDLVGLVVENFELVGESEKGENRLRGGRLACWFQLV